MPDAPSDQALLDEFRDTRSVDAFTAIVQRYGPMINGACSRVLKNKSDTDDVVQECLLVFYHNAHTISDSLPGWLHGVAVNRARNRIRDQITARERDRAIMTVAEPAPSSMHWDAVSEHLDNALVELPPELKEPIILHYLDGLNQASVSERMAINQATVSRRLKRGLRLLRKRLTGMGISISAVGLADTLSAHASNTVTQTTMNLWLATDLTAPLPAGPLTPAVATTSSALSGAWVAMASIAAVGAVATSVHIVSPKTPQHSTSEYPHSHNQVLPEAASSEHTEKEPKMHPTLTVADIAERLRRSIDPNERMGEYQTFRMRGTKTLPTGETFSFETIRKRPNLMYSVTTMGSHRYEDGYDGTIGWSRNPFQGVQTVSETMALIRQAFCDFTLVTAQDIPPTILPRLQLLGTVVIEGHNCYELQHIAPNGSDWRFYVDTQAVRGRHYSITFPNGDHFEGGVSEYQEFGDIFYPTSGYETLNGEKLTYQINAIEWNVDVPDTQFAMPETDGTP